MRLDKYRYRLVQQHVTSDRLGMCEICNKFVADMYSQSEQQQFAIGDGNEHWAYNRDVFGHRECLIGIRKK